MKMNFITIIYCLFTFQLTTVKAQLIEGTELGVDGFLSGSTLGGAFGMGTKFGFKTSENFIFGPTIRFNKAWSTASYTSQKYSYTNWGAGLFAHGRYGNVLFGGIEAEVMRNKNIFVNPTAKFKNFVPTVFICGGFSKEFNQLVRINVGLYYDLINSLNSPYRNAYIISIKDPNTGAIVRRLPMIYRISFFFPLTHKENEAPVDPPVETIDE
jgi:hypothetical protein